MKRLILFLLALLMIGSSASADTITAMARELYMDEYVSYSFYARIHDYDSETNMLEIELMTPEVFSRDEVENLSVGDIIYTDGREIAITSITEESAYIILNKGAYEFSEGSVWLSEDREGNYRPTVYGDYIWSEITRMDFPVTDRLIFLDSIDPLSGEMLEKPTVHTAEEFLKMKESEETEEDAGPGFKAHNVIVVFDRDGELAMIQRYYVPWQ